MTEPDYGEAMPQPDITDIRQLAPETPDADAVEQAIPANPADLPVHVHQGLEVAEWDAIEQARVVDLEEEYR